MFGMESNPIVVGHEPVRSDQLLDTSAWYDMSKSDGVYIVVVHYRGGDTSQVLTVHEGATAAGTTAITTGAEFPIWVATSALTDATLVRQTDAVTFTIDTATYTGTELVVFYIDGSILTNGYRYIQLGASGGNASSITTVLYIPKGLRFQGDQAL